MKLRMLNPSAVPVLKSAQVKVLEAKAGTTPRTSGRRWMRIREQVIADGLGACASCGRTHPSNQVDHIVPIEQAGTDDKANLQVLCVDCHSEKTATENRRRHGGC